MPEYSETSLKKKKAYVLASLTMKKTLIYFIFIAHHHIEKTILLQ